MERPPGRSSFGASNKRSSSAHSNNHSVARADRGLHGTSSFHGVLRRNACNCCDVWGTACFDLCGAGSCGDLRSAKHSASSSSHQRSTSSSGKLRCAQSCDVRGASISWDERGGCNGSNVHCPFVTGNPDPRHTLVKLGSTARPALSRK